MELTISHIPQGRRTVSRPCRLVVKSSRCGIANREAGGSNPPWDIFFFHVLRVQWNFGTELWGMGRDNAMYMFRWWRTQVVCGVNLRTEFSDSGLRSLKAVTAFDFVHRRRQQPLTRSPLHNGVCN